MNLVSCAKLDAELAEKQDKLLNCAGAPIPADTRIPTCAEMQDKLDKKLDKPTGGTDGQVLTIQPDGSAAWETPAAGGSGTTEFADGMTILGTGTSADKFRVARPIPSGGTSGQVPALKPDGTLEWVTPSSGGTGTTELADGTTILGVGTSADKFRVARPVPAGGTDGQVLTAQPDGSAAWETPASSGLDAVAVTAPLSGNGTSGSPLTFTGGTSGQVLTKQPDGSYAWTTLDVGTTEVADGTTILGAGTVADPFAVKNPIADGGTAGQIWTVKPDGTYGWVTPEPPSDTNAVSFFLGLL